jgi:hypothetical protein
VVGFVNGKTSVACIFQIGLSHVFISLPKASQLLFVNDQYQAACE